MAPPTPPTPPPPPPPARGAGGAQDATPPSSRRRSGRGASRRSSSAPFTPFAEHLGAPAAAALLREGAGGFEGRLRVNSRRRHQAYATLPGLGCDVLFDGFAAQNRAVEGDLVLYRLLPVDSWPPLDKEGDGEAVEAEERAAAEEEEEEAAEEAEELAEAAAQLALSPAPSPAGARPGPPAPPAPVTLAAAAAAASGPSARRPLAQVLCIRAPSPKRDVVIGYLEAPAGAGAAAAPPAGRGRGRSPAPAPAPARGARPGGKPLFWRLQPTDPRLPRMQVEPGALPAEALAAARDGGLGRLLFSARLARWSAGAAAPLASHVAVLGSAGEIETETAALVAEFGLDDVPFSPAVLACLPQLPPGTTWAVPAAELAQRRDFRADCVFSIDPPTARDLDDALSCDQLPPAAGRRLLRVGVHIADVAHFIPPGCALDAEAGRRCTSAYLVQRVIPMLPRLLCEELCSLNPGVERLTFSCVWTMDAESGEVLDEWMGRGVIRSAAKLDYAAAQRVIDAARAGGSGAEALAGCAVSPPHGAAACADAILRMHALAQTLRRARVAAGALRMDNSKLVFALDAASGAPLDCGQYVTGESHQLVEELMLLANRRVAAVVARAWPAAALLRRHPPPEPRKLDELTQFGRTHGLGLDTSSSAALHASLQALRALRPADAPLAVLAATKPQQLALYFCTGCVPEEAWGHYALAMPRYTHFTSPIRRYADVLVHRQLAAALAVAGGNACPPGHLLPSEALREAAAACNGRKLAAKEAQEASAKVYLCALLRAKPRRTHALVLATGPKYLQAFLPDYGFEQRIELEGTALPEGVLASGSPGGAVTLSRKPGAPAVAGPAEEEGVAAAPLPLQVKAFSRLPVLLTATAAAGKRSEVRATLLLC